MTLKEQIAKFERETGHKLTVRDCRPYYDGYLDLHRTHVTALPEGLVVGGAINLSGTSITTLPEGLTVGLYLNLCGTPIKTLPKSLIVGGDIYLRGCKNLTTLPEGLTVGRTLDLFGTLITELPNDITVGGSLDLNDTPIHSLPENLTVGGNIFLGGCTGLTALPEGLKVGGSLYLRGTSITALPNDLIVGGAVYIRGCKFIKELPEVIIGGSLDCDNKLLTPVKHLKSPRDLTIEKRRSIQAIFNRSIEWHWNGHHYIKADGEFTEVSAHRGNVYHVHYLGSTEQIYLVTDGEGHWAHGRNLHEAKEDLLYKLSERDISEYNGLSVDTELPFAELVAMYRTITGACVTGTRNFIQERLPKPHKDRYTIAEMIHLTEGEYGSDLIKEFFHVTNSLRK